MLLRGPILGAALALLGCSTTYDSIRFGPYLRRTPVRASAEQPVAAKVELRVDEVRERERRDGSTLVEVRVQIGVENRFAEAVLLLPEELSLHDADGVAFGPARVRRGTGGHSPEVLPGDRQVFDVFFPFAPGAGVGSRNLVVLRLAWALRFGDHVWREQLEFERLLVVDDGWYGSAGGYFHGHHGSPPAPGPGLYQNATPVGR